MNLKQLKQKSYKYKDDIQEVVGKGKQTIIQYVGDIKKSIYGFLIFLSLMYMANFAFTILVLRYL